MNQNIKNNQSSNQTLKKGIMARFAQILFGFIFLTLIMFFSSGTLLWTWAWVFLGIYLAGVSINGVILMRLHPETVAERGRPKEMKKWDKFIGAGWSLFQFLLVPLIAGLDIRFSWTGNLVVTWHIGGLIMFTLGLCIFSWAMISNAYFSTVVRIQTDRGQTVCQDGPYRFVRHPGYVGAILQSLGIPLLLGSWWALIPARLPSS